VTPAAGYRMAAMPATRTIPIPAVEAAAVLAARERTVVDLRSPKEFAEDHVPGALNVPLFDDVERAVIGTLYVKRSPDAAFAEARERTVENIGALTAAIAQAAEWDVPDVDLRARVRELTEPGIASMEGALTVEAAGDPQPGAVVLHCWRGGLRSRSVVALLRELGLERAVMLTGGYKSYRAEVRRRLTGWSAPATYVLRGLTGVGKSLVLREVERLRPRWTLDLETLAGHRSSILGMVGLAPCTQKTFESRLLRRVSSGFPDRCVVEGESRKVGDVVLPERVWEAVSSGVAIQLVATTETRVRNLIEDYLAHPENRAEIRAQLPFIEERLGRRKWNGVLVGLLDRGEEEELVARLLEHYYDPLYRHSEKGRSYVLRVDAGDPERAARELVDWIDGRRD